MAAIKTRQTGDSNLQIARIRHGDVESLVVRGRTDQLTLIDAASVHDLFGSNLSTIDLSGPAVAIDNVDAWLPPIPRPGKILGVAMNNSASNERKISAPDHPAFFIKPSSCLIGHQQPIRVRRYYGSVHPEPELAVVIGKTARDVDAVDALQAVFGYTVFNDITGNGMRADDLFHYWALYANDSEQEPERREQHLSYAARYKGTDTFGCMGPWLTSADAVADPDNLDVQCRIGGELIAEDSTRFYNFRVAEIISYISQYLTLEPGDVISCGTAFKARPGRRSIHQANFQSVPGPVEVHIEGLGTLVNPVLVEDREIGNWHLPAEGRAS